MLILTACFPWLNLVYNGKYLLLRIFIKLRWTRAVLFFFNLFFFFLNCNSQILLYFNHWLFKIIYWIQNIFKIEILMNFLQTFLNSVSHYFIIFTSTKYFEKAWENWKIFNIYKIRVPIFPFLICYFLIILFIFILLGVYLILRLLLIRLSIFLIFYIEAFLC